jgi:hypothetical protein
MTRELAAGTPRYAPEQTPRSSGLNQEEERVPRYWQLTYRMMYHITIYNQSSTRPESGVTFPTI